MIRIKVLEQENNSLHSTIEKLRRSASEVGQAWICAMLMSWIVLRSVQKCFGIPFFPFACVSIYCHYDNESVYQQEAFSWQPESHSLLGVKEKKFNIIQTAL